MALFDLNPFRFGGDSILDKHMAREEIEGFLQDRADSYAKYWYGSSYYYVYKDELWSKGRSVHYAFDFGNTGSIYKVDYNNEYKIWKLDDHVVPKYVLVIMDTKTKSMYQLRFKNSLKDNEI